MVRSYHALLVVICNSHHFLNLDFWNTVNWDTADDIVNWPFPFKLRVLSTQNFYGAPQLRTSEQQKIYLSTLK